jgi:hypothetical protein
MALVVVKGFSHVALSCSYVGPITSTVNNILIPLFDRVVVGWESFSAGFKDLHPFVVAPVFVNTLGTIACVLTVVLSTCLLVKEVPAAEQGEA